jgi:hypothetical protein
MLVQKVQITPFDVSVGRIVDEVLRQYRLENAANGTK